MRMTTQSEVPNDEEKRQRQCMVEDDDDDADADGDGADGGYDDDYGDGEKKAICRGRKMRHK